MEIKRLVISTYLGGVRNLTQDLFFRNFNFQGEDDLEDYDRGFLLGVKLCQNDDGSTSATLEEDNLEDILKCQVILMGDKFDELDIIERLADDSTGLLYHSSTCNAQKEKFKYKLKSLHVDEGNLYANSFRKLNRGTEIQQRNIDSVLELFGKSL